MEFKEENSIQIPLCYKSFIYFLIDNNEVVYIGQTKAGLIRPFSHRDKNYNEMKIILCDEKKLDEVEDSYIIKYKPKYNKEINNYYSLINSRNKIRKLFNNNITIPQLKKIMQNLKIKPYFFNEKLFISNTDFFKVVNYIKLKKQNKEEM